MRPTAEPESGFEMQVSAAIMHDEVDELDEVLCDVLPKWAARDTAERSQQLLSLLVQARVPQAK